MCFSAATKYIPLGIFSILFNSAPFFTVIMAYFWTGDKILPFEGVALLCAFGGVICIGLAKPEALEEKDTSNMSAFEQEHTYIIGITVSLVCAICYSTIAVASRRLKTIHYAVIQFTYGLFASIAMGIYFVTGCISAKHVPYVYDEWQVYFMILLCAFLNMVSQNLTTYCN